MTAAAKTKAHVERLPAGQWGVIQNGRVVRVFETQGAAWRWLDRQDDPKGEEQRRIRTAFTEKYY